jgi:hypothetical protein
MVTGAVAAGVCASAWADASANTSQKERFN